MNHALYTTRILLVSLIAPLAITLIALAVTFPLASTLPSQVAVHWDAAGVPDDFGSPYTFPILIAAICLPMDAIFGGIAVLTSHRSPMTVMTKIIAIVGLWLSVLFSVALGGTLILQHQVAVQAHASIVWLPIGAGVAIVVCAGAWFLLPKAAKSQRNDATPVPAVNLGAGERASWIRSVTAPAGLLWGFVGFMALVIGIILIAVFQKDGADWPVSFIPLVPLAIVLTNFAWTVRVDARGVRIRSTLGIPMITVPLANITSADVIDVQAIAQYGGFGFRWGLNGRFGVILRSGEALEVHRDKGRSIVVTIDDATTAAALINGLVSRAAASSGVA